VEWQHQRRRWRKGAYRRDLEEVILHSLAYKGELDAAASLEVIRRAREEDKHERIARMRRGRGK
jgi:hypothetical protein